MQHRKITRELVQKMLEETNLLLSANRKMRDNYKLITKLYKDNVKQSADVLEHFEKELEKGPDAAHIHLALSKVSATNLKSAAEAELALTQYTETIMRSEGIAVALETLSKASDQDFEEAVSRAEMLLGIGGFGSPPEDLPDFLSVGKKKGIIN